MVGVSTCAIIIAVIGVIVVNVGIVKTAGMTVVVVMTMGADMVAATAITPATMAQISQQLGPIGMAGGAMSVADAATTGTPTLEPLATAMVIGAAKAMILTTGAQVVATDDAYAITGKIQTLLRRSPMCSQWHAPGPTGAGNGLVSVTAKVEVVHGIGNQRTSSSKTQERHRNPSLAVNNPLVSAMLNKRCVPAQTRQGSATILIGFRTKLSRANDD